MSDDKINRRHVKNKIGDTDFDWIMCVLTYNAENPDFNKPVFRKEFAKVLKDTMELERSDRTIQRWCNKATTEAKRITQEQIENWKKDSETLAKIKYEISITEGTIISYMFIDKLRGILSDAERMKCYSRCVCGGHKNEEK